MSIMYRGRERWHAPPIVDVTDYRRRPATLRLQALRQLASTRIPR